MCELFGMTSAFAYPLNNDLEEFFSHSVRHPHGWGMARFAPDGKADIVKEPLQASKSAVLRQILSQPIRACAFLAHIRYATIGCLKQQNCHPFTGADESGRNWTMIHNGTIFYDEPIRVYAAKQQGTTDSERLFLYLLSLFDEKRRAIRRELTAEERFHLLDATMVRMAAGNKMNLMLYDGETLYAHTNYAHSLCLLEKQGAALLSTVPLSDEDWQPFPMTQLLGFQRGKRVFTGTDHGQVYCDNERDRRYLCRVDAVRGDRVPGKP